MYHHARRAGFAAAALFVLSGAAQASATFSWNPRAVQLDGTKFSADTLLLGDYDQIVLGSGGGGGTTFTETGYLPIEGFALAGQAVRPTGFNDPSGNGWGAYVQYSGSGIQVLSQYGTPQAVYQQLSYQIIGYNGLATFGIGTNGAAVLGGAVSNATVLEQGSLVSGQLTFVPTPAGLAIEGSIAATLDEVKPQFAVGQVSGFDLSIDHPPSDYAFASPGVIEVASTSGGSATLLSGNGKVMQASLADQADPPADPSGDPPSAVPEPASALLLGAGLLGSGIVRLRQRRRSRHE